MVDLSTSEQMPPQNSGAGIKRTWALVSVFTLSIFLSAGLLFSVQPMFTKLVLPLLGGSSSVWNTAMVFFQAMLLGGYIYAHVISKFLGLKWQIICHVAVMSVGLLFLPLSIASGWTPPEQGAQAFWLIALFAVSVGVPFFAISANSPLLQRWFSRTDDKDADDPYFLYAASNAGSLLSLCLYPILFEPLLKLQEQTHIWAIGYGLLIAVILFAGIAALRNQKAIPVIEATKAVTSIAVRSKAFWVFLAFIPSSLMLGVTSFMSNTIASVPFLWITPLVLYLLTFIIVFAKKPIVTTAQLAMLFPAIVVLAIVAGFVIKSMTVLSIILSLIAYFTIALLCHSRLADLRPETSHLTEFYIWMSVGGVLGGIFNALIAPQIFSNVHEYIIILLVANFAVPKLARVKEGLPTLQLLVKFILPTWFVYLAIVKFTGYDFYQSGIILLCVWVVGLSYLRGRGAHMWASLIGLGLFIIIVPIIFQKNILTDRSFYSVLRVNEVDSPSGKVYEFLHGDTVHNLQLRHPELRQIPLAYYGHGNTFHTALEAVRAQKPDVNVTVIGLGAGAMACHEQAGDKWTYLELDQAVIDMAMNPKYFTYMQDCSKGADVIVGDARLTVSRLPKASQDMIMVDAFSSNSIPAHLLTVEAMALYTEHLSESGVIFFHTSNRSMDVASIVVRVAEASGLDSRYISLNDFKGPHAKLQHASNGVLVGSAENIARVTGADETWKAFEPSPHVKAWTDDFSSVIGALRAGMDRGTPKEAH